MEYENLSEMNRSPFDFLSDEYVNQHFADLNFALLNGRHVQQRDGDLFLLLNDCFEDFLQYYKSLYGLHLSKNIRDDFVYYYLDIPDYTPSKMALEHSRQLTQTETIIGIMLLNMYYDRYFDDVKEIHWSHIRTEILEGKNSELYKKLFFGDVRDSYSPQEWGRRGTNFKNTIRTFDKLGWVERCSSASSKDINDISFIIQPSIHRLATLYEQELEDFDSFVKSYYQNRQT